MPDKTGRITFDDATFQRLVNGETLKMPVQPDTTRIEIRLDERSRFRKSYSEILAEVLQKKNPLTFHG